jgi:Zn-dependent protease
MRGDQDDELFLARHPGRYPDYMPPRVAFYPPPGYRMPRTSRQEILDLSIAVAVLTIVFAMVGTGGAWALMGAPLWLIGGLFGLAFVAVMLSIFPHELAHKFVAQRYGYWAEFRRNDQFLMISLLLSLFAGFGIAAPGAVMIAGPVTTESNGKISAVGPGTNGLMAAIFLPITMFSGHIWWVQYLAAEIAWVNIVLGIFNLIPFGIFDGAKVWKWSAGAYLAILALLIALGVLVFRTGIIF